MLELMPVRVAPDVVQGRSAPKGDDTSPKRLHCVLYGFLRATQPCANFGNPCFVLVCLQAIGHNTARYLTIAIGISLKTVTHEHITCPLVQQQKCVSVRVKWERVPK